MKGGSRCSVALLRANERIAVFFPHSNRCKTCTSPHTEPGSSGSAAGRRAGERTQTSHCRRQTRSTPKPGGAGVKEQAYGRSRLTLAGGKQRERGAGDGPPGGGMADHEAGSEHASFYAPPAPHRVFDSKLSYTIHSNILEYGAT